MARSLLAGLILSLFAASTGWAASPNPSAIVTPAQPKWSDLSVQQRIILAPLSDDWDSLENSRQKKWIGIAERFSAMPPKEQQRIQIQMQEWGKLTDEQRQVARAKFLSAKQLPAEEKQALKKKWEEYANLPEEEKTRLKALAQQKAEQSAAPYTVPSIAPATIPLLKPTPATTATGIPAAAITDENNPSATPTAER